MRRRANHAGKQAGGREQEVEVLGAVGAVTRPTDQSKFRAFQQGAQIGFDEKSVRPRGQLLMLYFSD
jgi:hypothetical protein